MNTLTRILGTAAVVLLLAYLSGSWWSEKARDRAREAERVAAVAVEKAQADSITADSLRSAYELEREARLAASDSLVATARALAEAERQRSLATARHQAQLDSVVASIGDTVTMVPRAVHDAAISAARATIASLSEEKELVAEQRDAEHERAEQLAVLWREADAALVAEAMAAQSARDALADQIKATEAWKRAASPGVLRRLLSALPKVGIGVGIGYVAHGAK